MTKISCLPSIYTVSSYCSALRKREVISMNKQHITELRQKYIQNPPEGMFTNDIQNMNNDDLVVMNYFTYENTFEESFYILCSFVLFLCARKFGWHIFLLNSLLTENKNFLIKKGAVLFVQLLSSIRLIPVFINFFNLL